MTIVPMQYRTSAPVMVLQILFLSVITLLSFTVVAAGNSSNDWLKPAREALNVARQTLQSFDPVEGDTEALDPWDRVLGEIRLNAQKCVDARLEAINGIKGALKPADNIASAVTLAPALQTDQRLADLEAEMTACQSLLLQL